MPKATMPKASMKVISRYLLAQLVAVTLVVTLVLTAVVWLIRSLRFIDLIVNRGLPVDTFLWLMVLLLPSFMAVVLPIATFCAVLFVYNKLTMDSEMVALRAAGLSHLQLAMPALVTALGATLVVYSITLYFQPVSYHAFKNMEVEIRNDLAAVFLQDGVFHDIGKGLTIYVRHRSADGVLHGILVHDSRAPQSPVTILAERGALTQGEDGTRVVLLNGTRQEARPWDGPRDGAMTSSLKFDRYGFDLGQFQAPTHRSWRNRKERFLPELLNPGPLPGKPLLRNELIAEGHQRLILPLYAIAFVVVGLAALLSGEFTHRSQVWRVRLAILAVAGLECLQLALRDLAARGSEGIGAMYAAVLLPTGLAFYLFLRGQRRQPAAPRPRKVAVP